MLNNFSLKAKSTTGKVDLIDALYIKRISKEYKPNNYLPIVRNDWIQKNSSCRGVKLSTLTGENRMVRFIH